MGKKDIDWADYLKKAQAAQKRIEELNEKAELQDELTQGYQTLEKMNYSTRIMETIRTLKSPLKKENVSALYELCDKFDVPFPENPTNADYHDLAAYNVDMMRCKNCRHELATAPCYTSHLELRDGRIRAVSDVCKVPLKWEIIRRSKMPSIYMGKEFEKDYIVPSQDFLTICEKAIKGLRGLYLYGAPRTGKTFASCCIINHRADSLKSSLFWQVSELMMILSNFDDKAARAEVLFKAKNVPLLVIDDIGSEYPSEYNASLLYEIVDFRYSNELPLVCTSNFAPRQLSSAIFGHYGGRIVSRLQEMCYIYCTKQ